MAWSAHGVTGPPSALEARTGGVDALEPTHAGGAGPRSSVGAAVDGGNGFNLTRVVAGAGGGTLVLRAS